MPKRRFTLGLGGPVTIAEAGLMAEAEKSSRPRRLPARHAGMKKPPRRRSSKTRIKPRPRLRGERGRRWTRQDQDFTGAWARETADQNNLPRPKSISALLPDRSSSEACSGKRDDPAAWS